MNLYRRPKQPWDFTRRYCLHPPTQVLVPVYVDGRPARTKFFVRGSVHNPRTAIISHHLAESFFFIRSRVKSANLMSKRPTEGLNDVI